MKTYRHSWFAHFLCLVGAIFWTVIGLGIEFGTSGKITPLAQIVALLMFAGTALTLAFYFTSVMNRYEVMPEGLRVLNRSRVTFHPWKEITLIKWSASARTAFVYAGNKRIFYSSIDCFPHALEFLRIIHHWSNCQLSPWLERTLANEHHRSL